MSSRLAIRIGGAALSLAALAACSDPVTAPSARTPVLDTPSFAIDPVETGKMIVCVAAGGTDGSFTVVKAARVGDATTGPAVTSPFNVTAGNCVTVWTRPDLNTEPLDNPQTDFPVDFTVSLTSGNSTPPVSTIDFAVGDACDGVAPAPAGAQGVGTTTVTACANFFHGTRVTFYTTPPVTGGCTYTKGWYRNNGSSTVTAVDSRSKTDAQAIFNATPGKPGNVTWEGDNNTLNLYQQLLAAILNGGLNGPQAVQDAIGDAQDATGGAGQNITLVPGTDVSGLIDALTYFNEGNYAGWPHCS